MAVCFPRITQEVEGISALPEIQQVGGGVGERGLCFHFQDWDFPAAWSCSEKNNNKKKIKPVKKIKLKKLDLQWNNIIFIVTATVVPWESRMLENLNFSKGKEFTSLNKILGNDTGQEYSIPHLILFSVSHLRTLQNPKQDSEIPTQ